MDRKTEKKLRLFYLLPYGITSRSSMILATKMPDIAFLEYSQELSMEERCKEFDKAHHAANRQLDRMLESGYLEDISRKYEKNRSSQFRMVRLTQAGLYLLASTPDEKLEMKRLDNLRGDTDRKKKENTYQSDSVYDRQLREQWYVAATNPDALRVDREILNDAFLEAVYEGDMTILALDCALAKEVSVTSNASNGWQIYRDWRLANITALFMANDFLTFLDRRPMDTKWVVSGIQNEEDLAKQIQGGTLNLPGFMFHVLNRWYSEHPTSYRFTDPGCELTGETEEDWKATPAFYSAIEIPGFFNEENSFGSISLTGAKNALRHTFCGVAIGRKKTYIVYHTKPGKTPWSERVEQTTADAVYKFLCDANGKDFATREPEITSAIMVCHGVHQFAKLFENAKKHMANKWRKSLRVGIPYDTVSIVPINASGAMQLRGLMLMTPADYDLYMINKLKAQDSRFERTQETLYPLNFNNVPVLVAHSMDFQKLFWALEDYYDGEKFYVSCFPGQVKYIQKIMPNVEFL